MSIYICGIYIVIMTQKTLLTRLFPFSAWCNIKGRSVDAVVVGSIIGYQSRPLS
jgi:hypothetical protein